MAHRILLSAIAIAALLFAVFGLAEESDRRTVQWAELGALRHTLSEADRLAAEQVLGNHVGDCRADYRRAATALSVGSGLPDETARQPGLLEESVRAQLRCSPADGNAWLLLAIASQEAQEPEMVVRYTNLSQADAPREGWIIDRRVDLISSSEQPAFDALRPALQRDFEVLLGDHLFDKVSAHASRYSQRTGPVLEAALANVDMEIRDSFVRDAALRQAKITQ